MLKAQKFSFLHSLKTIFHEDDERQDDSVFEARKTREVSKKKKLWTASLFKIIIKTYWTSFINV